MTLQLKIVSEHRELVGDDDVREFHEEGGTIGRSLRNDWILPDPDRYISGRHATIDHKGGIYYLLDTSSNGVYFNDEVEPVGKGNPRRLFNGDRIRMGDFEFLVSLDSGESLSMPLDPEPSVAPDHIEQFVDEASPRTGVKLLDEEELTGDEEFQSVLFGNQEKPKPEPLPQKKTANRAANEAQPAEFPTESAEAAEASSDELFESFLDGLGISRAELHPAVNRKEMMLTAGHILREFVEGVMRLLAARANLKNDFRLDQTVLLPLHNNPLKFSESPSDLVKQLLIGDEGDYLGAKDAVHEACQDLLNHQNAFLHAMNSAFTEFADRFEPNELEAGFNRAISSNKLFAFMNKSKYWDLYRDLYPIMTEKGDERFPRMFGEEFVKAYERQVAQSRRQNRVQPPKKSAKSGDDEPGLLATQKLEPRVIAENAAAAKLSASQTNVEPYVDQVDQSFIHELDNSMAEELSEERREPDSAA